MKERGEGDGKDWEIPKHKSTIKKKKNAEHTQSAARNTIDHKNLSARIYTNKGPYGRL